jgi:hypothetical protein
MPSWPITHTMVHGEGGEGRRVVTSTADNDVRILLAQDLEKRFSAHLTHDVTRLVDLVNNKVFDRSAWSNLAILQLLLDQILVDTRLYGGDLFRLDQNRNEIEVVHSL